MRRNEKKKKENKNYQIIINVVNKLRSKLEMRCLHGNTYCQIIIYPNTQAIGIKTEIEKETVRDALSTPSRSHTEREWLCVRVSGVERDRETKRDQALIEVLRISTLAPGSWHNWGSSVILLFSLHVYHYFCLAGFQPGIGEQNKTLIIHDSSVILALEHTLLCCCAVGPGDRHEY